MDFFKLKKFRKEHKPKEELPTEPVLDPEEPKKENIDVLGKSANADSTNTEVEDDDDDFITNEVKRRLKELRRNSFMVLIPEETAPEEEDVEEEEEEEGETSSCEWRDVEAEGRQFWSGFDAVYERYCERMLFFDRLNAQQLREVGSHAVSSPSPKSASKGLASPFRCLSLKNFEQPEEETENLQQQQQLDSNPYHDLETAYVAQVCLTWEALHCQYTQLSNKISSQPESSTCYSHSAQQFQQFQVLLQRFIENEPFEHGLRPEIYARARTSLPKLLQVPKIQGSEEKKTGEEESDYIVLATDLIRTIESSILSFRQFLKMDKTRVGGIRKLFGSQNQMATPLQQIQSSHEKKEMKLKEQWKKRKSSNKNESSWPNSLEDAEMLLGLIDAKVVSRVLRMARISKEQLFWCEEKMKKLAISHHGNFHRDPSPILFPC